MAKYLSCQIKNKTNDKHLQNKNNKIYVVVMMLLTPYEDGVMENSTKTQQSVQGPHSKVWTINKHGRSN